ncbi:HNH endonuclease signature motif containing protein [Blastococcus sp. TF02A-30]|uniref:HNH endonuclease signature motif containing protein n=1 Tax=Blastococcus sp. TF02A-30 TaxID=2250580 RepID=UPI0018F5B4D1|nr:HNH endonuclease signature motif containing protein [Blastococcus sp. TF02A-30]
MGSNASSAVDRVAGALDELAAEPIEELAGPALIERLGPLLAVLNRVGAEVARTVRRCEVAGAGEHDGKATMASWLRGHARLPAGSANQLVRAGRALEQLPAIAEAASAGALPVEALAAVAPVVEPGNLAAAAEQGVDVGEVDRLLAGVAATRPYAELRQVVAHYLARLDPDGPEPDPTESRRLSWTRHDDGSMSGRFELDAIGGEKLLAAVESILQASRPAGDDRSRSQRQADALVQLCDNALASATLPVLRTRKPQVAVTVPLADLVDPAVGQGAGRTGFGAVISAAKARWLACDGQVTRIVLGPDSQPLDLGREQRVAPPGLRRAVEQRDGHCVFAGCDAPSWWCDVHHLFEWLFGGETTLENSGLLCERHHTKVHHGFRIDRDPAGRWHTYRPDGTEILFGEPFLLLS